MRTFKTIFTVTLKLLAGQIGYGQISGTSHDFSSATWNISGGICKSCHTPHNALDGYSPLWNHEVTTSEFTLYASATFNGAVTIGNPDGASKLCLSCHDGTVALENYGGVITGTNFIAGAALIGSNLGNDHPVSFDYTPTLAVADGRLFNPGTTLSGITPGGTIADDMLDAAGKLQCTSCHNPHESTYGKFLIKSNTGSGLCLTCHNMGNVGIPQSLYLP